MLGLTWIAASLRRRRGRLAATSLGIALGVGLLASIGVFLAHSKATMTRRATATVAVDWQVQASSSADPSALLHDVRAYPSVRRALPVNFADTTGLAASVGGTTQSTGPGVVVGLPDRYASTFPGELRNLVGSPSGVLLAQQTAANLHAAPGDVVTIGRAGLPSATVTVDGVVDLPQADSLFQQVGAPTGAQPTAPPDNVVLVPAAQWHTIFDPLATAHPEALRTQVHAKLSRHLPADPVVAYSQVTNTARNLELRLAGNGLVGDNLGAALASARSDALYAQVLFVFLGLPGAILAGILTATVASAGAERRRREQALLRTRGATTARLVRLAVAEALLVGVLGAVGGLALALLVGRLAFHSTTFGASGGAAVAWTAAATLVGLAIAAVAIAAPAWRDARRLTVTGARRAARAPATPLWARLGVDLALLAGAALVFWLTSRNGYQIVLAVEGVPQISVSYWAFAGPALLWLGAGLLSWRLANVFLHRGRRPLTTAVRPVSGPLASTVAASMSRQRRLLARGVMLVMLTIAFAAATAVFNATYRQQAEVDARLTNGGDVTVTEPPGGTAGSAQLRALAAVPGVGHVEPVQHRFAYVGTDLQDLYGVNPTTVVNATKLQDAYFQGGSATTLMDQLARRPDSILVSAETVKDFQLRPGDTLSLRLQDGRTKQYRDVTFHYAGIAKEFPTAPRDSFLIANASYVARQTGNPAVGAFLIDTGSTSPRAVAQQVRAKLGTAATVTDIQTSRKIVGSSLTAVDLTGLTRVELGFALALAAASTGLVLWLGLAERRRTFAIATALGAKGRQLGGFVWSEALFVFALGTLLGAVGAWALSEMLVKVLTGVFDPPPATLAVPWGYLGTVFLVAAGALAVAGTAAIRASRRPAVELLRVL